MSKLTKWWKRRHCLVIGGFCARHDVYVKDLPEIKEKCPSLRVSP